MTLPSPAGHQRGAVQRGRREPASPESRLSATTVLQMRQQWLRQWQAVTLLSIVASLSSCGDRPQEAEALGGETGLVTLGTPVAVAGQ